MLEIKSGWIWNKFFGRRGPWNTFDFKLFDGFVRSKGTLKTVEFKTSFHEREETLAIRLRTSSTEIRNLEWETLSLSLSLYFLRYEMVRFLKLILFYSTFHPESQLDDKKSAKLKSNLLKLIDRVKNPGSLSSSDLKVEIRIIMANK